MRVIPNMRVLIPADTTSVVKLTNIISKQHGPFYMRLSRSKTHIIHHDNQEFSIGKGILLRDGSDCTIAACGITVKLALEAATLLKKEGISCRVIDMFSIKPIDTKIIEKAAKETGFIVTCEEHNTIAGFGSAVCEITANKHNVLVKRIGIQDQFGESARDNELHMLLEKHGLSSINIVKNIKDTIRNENLS